MDIYVDGFLLAIPAARLNDYIRVANKAGSIWKEYGALDYRECVGDALDAPDMVSFRQAAGAKEDELVIFAWITYPDKASRDDINTKVMNDPRMKNACEGIFDYTRMSWGGFKTIVHV